MSRDTPAHVRRPGTSTAGGPTSGGDASDEAAAPGGDAPPTVRALRGLRPPRHAAAFWTRLDERLADEPQLRLAPRSAIRPITQPPPVIDDSSLASSLKGGAPPPRRRTGRTAVMVVAAILVALVGIAALQDPDDDVSTGPEREAETDAGAGTDGGRTPTSEDAPASTAAPTTAPPGAIDPAAPLTPTGVGPLAIGASMADLQAAGVQMQVDRATFDGSGGRCYDAKIPGSLDLLLRFRPPDGVSSVEDPTQGILASVSIEAALPTARATDTGLALGAPQDQVLAAYGGNLDDRSHPFLSGGRILRADAGNGRGIAFFTDGAVVNRISVGLMETIRFINQCE